MLWWTLLVILSTARPNIVLVTVDALRPDRLGIPLTPTLDSLAQQGVVFTNAFTCSPWTSPALISCLTGRHEPAHGVDTREKSLSPSVPTLPGCLVASGYRAPDICYLVGSPNYQNLRFEDFPLKMEYLTTGHHIIFRWLETFGVDHQPFFLYYHYRDLHQPYDPSPPFDTLFLPGGRPPQDPDALERFTTIKTALLVPEGKLAFQPQDTGWVRGLYDGQVAEADARFFRPLFATLSALGLADHTLVVVTADHGEELLEHGNVGHASTSLAASLYDEELRIPLLMAGPGVPKGVVIPDLVQIVDIMPTLLDLVGVPIPQGVQGRSLVPLLLGHPQPEHPVFVSSVLGGYQATPAMQAIRLRAVRTAEWKLLRRDEPSGSRRKLFHLVSDPLELRDCATQHQAIADSLEALLEAWLASCRALYERPLWAGDGSRQGEAVNLQVLAPAQGESLDFTACQGRIRIHLLATGTGDLDIEYSVGQGPYHVEGKIPSGPDGVSYGPFTPTFWNTLVRYNPWSFRAMPSGRPDQATPWVTFYLKPCP